MSAFLLLVSMAWGAEYDCLGGTCLNAPSASNSSSVVKFAGMDWEKVVESCSGVVTSVILRSMWANPAAWNQVKDKKPPLYFQPDSADGSLSRLMAVNASIEMVEGGWRMGDAKKLNTGVTMDLTHPQKSGTRGLVHGPVDNLGSMVLVVTMHPDLNRLCSK